MGFNEARAELVDAVFAELKAGSAVFVTKSGDQIDSVSVRIEQDQDLFPDYQGQRSGFRMVIRYKIEDIDRDVYKGEYFLLDDVKYYVAEMVETEGSDMTRRVRVTTQ